jgi:hypothetical protein
MAIDFPASPTNGQVFAAANGINYVYASSPGIWTTAVFTNAPAILQQVFLETGAVATGTTIIPGDDTIPQITEGDQYMTLAITPRSATSRLVIQVVFIGSHSSGSTAFTAALFQDTTANALAAARVDQSGAAFMNTIAFTHAMVSGTTSSTTFRIRAGSQAAGTTTFNGSGGLRIYGGAMASSIIITEYLL